MPGTRSASVGFHLKMASDSVDDYDDLPWMREKSG
jgi:hypothetical protein